jgi:purine nucleosidase
MQSGKISMVLDTDTYNEIDDQFALVYALKSGSRLQVEAVYAAPFSNDRASDPGTGMEKSHEEILRVLERMGIQPPEGFVHRGSTQYLQDASTPCESAAARDLVRKAMSATEPLYVVAIGAITNIASAILMEPGITEKIVVVWLGGHALYWPDTREFNLRQDVLAAQVVLDCGVPLVQIPCLNVASHLTTTVHELKAHLAGKSAIADYLYGIFCEYVDQHKRLSKEIWDIAAIAYLVNPDWVATRSVHSPILHPNLTWRADTGRHFIRTAVSIDRDAIFRDMFEKLQGPRVSKEGVW